MKGAGWLSAAIYLVLVTAAFPQGPEARPEIERLEEQTRQATLKGDLGFLEKYLAPDYLAVMGNGRAHGKADELHSWQSGSVTYQMIDVHELKIRIYGDTAICNSLASVKLTAQEKGYKTVYNHEYSGDYRFTRVWVKQGGEWRIVSFQSTKAGD